VSLGAVAYIVNEDILREIVQIYKDVKLNRSPPPGTPELVMGLASFPRTSPVRVKTHTLFPPIYSFICLHQLLAKIFHFRRLFYVFPFSSVPPLPHSDKFSLLHSGGRVLNPLPSLSIPTPPSSLKSPDTTFPYNVRFPQTRRLNPTYGSLLFCVGRQIWCLRRV
jgi:hypothetical protein